MKRLHLVWLFVAAFAAGPAFGLDDEDEDKRRNRAFIDRPAPPSDLSSFKLVAGVSKEGVISTFKTLGEGPSVVLIPSLGRGADDFDHLARRLAARGYRAITINPDGVQIGDMPKGAPPSETSDLYDLGCGAARALAEDYRLRGEAGTPPAVFIGHAFGNRVVRALAADRPDLVRGLILLAAGGQVAIAPEVRDAIARSGDPTLPEAERLASLELAFFAPGNDPAVWLGGWYPDVMRRQVGAIERTSDPRWKNAPTAPTLIVQPAQDRVAPPANAEAIAAMDANIRVVTIEKAGHALLPEQGEAVAEAVIAFLQGLPAMGAHGVVAPPKDARCQDLP